MKKITLILTWFCFITSTKAQNVGIGIPNPAHPLTVQSSISNSGVMQKSGNVELGFYVSSQFAYLQTWTPHDLNFATNNGGAKMTISNTNGFVVINNVNPLAQMDINGTLRIRGNGAASGKVLTSDASGNATWSDIIRNEVYSVGSLAFQPETSSNPLYRTTGQGGVYFVTASASATFVAAPVNLPQGAVITQITMFFRDNVASDLNLSFIAEDLTFSGFNTLATANTSGASTNWRSVVLTLAAPIVINNNTLAYSVKAYGTWTGNFDLAVKGAVIKYSYTPSN